MLINAIKLTDQLHRARFARSSLEELFFSCSDCSIAELLLDDLQPFDARAFSRSLVGLEDAA